MARKRKRQLGSTDDTHRTLFETAEDALYRALEGAEAAATCRRRAAAVERAYEEWGHMVSESIASSARQQDALMPAQNQASEALYEGRTAFERRCLRERGTG